MKNDNKNENKPAGRAVPVIISSVLIMGLAGAGAWYLNREKPDLTKAELPAAETTFSVTEALTEAVTSEESTTAETSAVTTEEAEKEFVSVNSPAHIFGRVNTSNGDLNMRKAPSSSADISGKLKKDTLVYIAALNDKWYEVETAEGEYAYVSSDYIELNSYTGSWKEKYRQLSSDVSEYFTASFGNSGSLGFYLTDFDNDTIPELVYSYISDDENGPSFLQFFSADSSSLKIDRRRYGTIEKTFSDGNSRVLLMSRDFRGECKTAISYTKEKISEKIFIHSNFSYQREKSPDLYLINGISVSESEYSEGMHILAEYSEDELLDYKSMLKKLDSYKAEETTGNTETVIYPENTEKGKAEITEFDQQTALYYGMIISDSAEVPLYYDSKGRKRCTYEKSGTIVEVTGTENGMYSIFYRPEGKNTEPEMLYINAEYVQINTSVSSWQNKYDETVRLTENSNGDRQSTSYMLADMDSDDIPELICSITSACSDTRYTHIYSIHNGELYSYSISGSRASVSFYPETGCIGISGPDRDESITVISIKQGKFKIENTLSHNSHSGEEDDDEYLIDGDAVTRKGYYDTRILLLGGSSEYNEEEDEHEYEEPDKEYCTLSASEIISKIAESK